MKYLIKGKIYEPIKVGDSGDWCQDENDTCGDCGKGYGENHLAGCDIERCPSCGGQLISCDCSSIYEVEDDISKEELEKLIQDQKEENDLMLNNNQQNMK